jgi:hypothetical protein
MVRNEQHLFCGDSRRQLQTLVIMKQMKARSLSATQIYFRKQSDTSLIVGHIIDAGPGLRALPRRSRQILIWRQAKEWNLFGWKNFDDEMPGIFYLRFSNRIFKQKRVS